MKGGEFLDHLNDYQLFKEFQYNEHLSLLIIVVLQLKNNRDCLLPSLMITV